MKEVGIPVGKWYEMAQEEGVVVWYKTYSEGSVMHQPRQKAGRKAEVYGTPFWTKFIIAD